MGTAVFLWREARHRRVAGQTRFQSLDIYKRYRFRTPSAMVHSMAESLAQFFLTHFQAHREERAYGQRRGYRMQWFTYGQLLEMASAFARDLGTQGIGKGERVMLWGENSAAWVAAFVGCAMRGVVVVPMDDGASSDFAARVARQVGARLWVCSRKHATESLGSVPVAALEEIKIPTSRKEGEKLGHSCSTFCVYRPRRYFADCLYFRDHR